VYRVGRAGRAGTPALLLLCYCFATASLLIYCCGHRVGRAGRAGTPALLLFYYFFANALLFFLLLRAARWARWRHSRFTNALLLLYYCFTNALLFLHYCGLRVGFAGRVGTCRLSCDIYIYILALLQQHIYILAETLVSPHDRPTDVC
jgi:hypothetical protein